MDTSMLILWIVFPLTLIWCIIITARSGKNHPPGPTPLPIIGNLHLLGEHPHKSLAKLAKTHGPVMSLKLGQRTTVVISSSAAAKEVLQRQDVYFSNRSVSDCAWACNHALYSVVWLPVASEWRNLRRIMNSHVFSASRLDANQQLRSEKVQELIGFCQKSCQSGEAVDIGQAAFRTSLNILSNVFFSKDLTDPFAVDSAKEFKSVVWNIMMESGRPNVVDFFPVLKKFDPQGIRGRMTIHVGKMLDICKALINERLESKKSGDPIMDVLDGMLSLIEENPRQIDRDFVEHLFLDLFNAGTDTTSSTLEWAMSELLRNPHTLQKAQAELAEVVGRGKQIKEADVTCLPYLQCVVKETFRMHPAVPLLIPHKVECNVELFGYIVPKGSQVLVNAWAIGRDETIWEDPLVFKPERFAESQMDVRGQDFELIPFGAGRRICPGMSLALRTIPIVLGSLLNMFDWNLEGGMNPEELDMDEKFGITPQKAQPLLALPVPIAFNHVPGK